MVVLLSNFAWCTARLGKDGNWWIKEVSEEQNWDFEVPGFLSPEQIKKVFKQSESELKPYGISTDDWNKAFYRFKVDKYLDNRNVRLVCTEERLQGGEKENLFALPNEAQDDDCPYGDFLDKLIRARTEFLNDRIDFVEKLSCDEIQEIMRETRRALYFEGASLHVFREFSDVLNYIPSGFELRDG